MRQAGIAKHPVKTRFFLAEPVKHQNSQSVRAVGFIYFISQEM